MWEDAYSDEEVKGMNKKIQKKLFIIVIFIICFATTKIISDRTKLLESVVNALKLRQENVEMLKEITTLINGVWSFVVAQGINIFKLYLEHNRDIKKGMPQISIMIQTVTCPRKTRRKDSLLNIDIGNGLCFVYVISFLKNVGERTIVECYINEKKLEINSLDTGDCYDFCFRICREENRKYKKAYKIILTFKDDKGESFEKNLY